MSLSRRPYPTVEQGLLSRQQLRKGLLDWRESMPIEQHRALTQSIGALLIDQLSTLITTLRDTNKTNAQAPCIGVYWPIRGEPDLRNYYHALINLGYRLALPFIKKNIICGTANSYLTYAQWVLGEPTITGKYAIEQPKVIIEIIPDLILAPCVGFDVNGYRLGYGAGYFDQTLKRQPIKTIGIAFAATQVDDLHPRPSDVRLNAILTESGVQSFSD